MTEPLYVSLCVVPIVGFVGAFTIVVVIFKAMEWVVNNLFFNEKG